MSAASTRPFAAALVRFIAFAGLWLVLVAGGSGRFSLADAIAGTFAAGVAAWASLRLSPPRSRRVRLLGCLALALHFLRHSVAAGWDVARRAFDPRLPLKTGRVSYRSGLTDERDRAGFRMLTSLMPGTLPFAERKDGTIDYHCLDVGQPIVENLERDQARHAAAVGGRHPTPREASR